MDGLAKKYKIPLLSIAIVTNDSVTSEFIGSYDESIGEHGAEKHFPIYSITKTFIAVLLLKLAQAGKVDLDDPVAKWISDAPEGHRYSLRQLLNNTSGLPDYYWLDSYRRDVKAKPSQAWTREEYIHNTYSGQLEFEAGQGWLYSNLGFMFLRETIEKVTGLSFSEALKSHIFLPLGFSESQVLSQPSDFLSLVSGFSKWISDDGTPKDVRGVYHPGWVAHGVIASSAREVAFFFREVFLGNLIQKAYLQQLTALVRVPGEHSPFVTPSYGLGLMGDPDSKLGPSFGHGGGGPGYALHASFWPKINGGVAATAFGNSEQANMPMLMEDLGCHLQHL